MPLTKPPSVESDPFRSAKWDELSRGRGLGEADAPALELLVRWHAVAESAMRDIDDAGGMVAYQDDKGNLRKLPQVDVLKEATGAICALEKRLGAAESPAEEPERKEAPLHVIKFRREARAAGA